MEHIEKKTVNSDLQERVIWGKISPQIESAIQSINGQIEKRTNKSIIFKSSGAILEIKIERV
jgi:hypothetical protein